MNDEVIAAIVVVIDAVLVAAGCRYHTLAWPIGTAAPMSAAG